MGRSKYQIDEADFKFALKYLKNKIKATTEGDRLSGVEEDQLLKLYHELHSSDLTLPNKLEQINYLTTTYLTDKEFQSMRTSIRMMKKRERDRYQDQEVKQLSIQERAHVQLRIYAQDNHLTYSEAIYKLFSEKNKGKR
jgi:hypothetical protein